MGLLASGRPSPDTIGRLLLAAVGLTFLGANALHAFQFVVHRDSLFFVVDAVYRFNTLYLPALLAAAALGLMALRPASVLLQRAPIALVVVAVLVFGTRVWATNIEPRLLQVRTERIGSPKVRRPLRIVHLSDIQSDRVGDYEREVVEVVRGLQPDIVVHTGDLLHPVSPATYASELPRIDRLLRERRVPFFTVMGDTDPPIEAALQRGVGGMEYLSNTDSEVRTDAARVRILGLSLADSHDPASGRPIVDAWLRDSSPNDVTLVLGHAPDFMLGTQDVPVDLQLAGHTHGGQIRIPFVGPLLTLSRVPKTWARGFRAVGPTHINVSAGVGAEHAAGLPSILMFCPPELTLIEIVPR